MDNSPENKNKKVSKTVRWIYIISGTTSFFIGVAGVVLPLLPATPFLLFSAFCYARSSEKFYNKLMGSKIFGDYIKSYKKGNGMPLHAKIIVILILWSTILISAFTSVDNMIIQILLFGVAIGVTIHLAIIKTTKEK
jgi:uncharacterized membrane protein YbaN (DUF454 family)